MIAQGSIDLSQILDPAPPAEIVTLSHALKVYQVQDLFCCRSFIKRENIGCFQVIVLNFSLVQGLEQACQLCRHTAPSQLTLSAFPVKKILAPIVRDGFGARYFL